MTTHAHAERVAGFAHPARNVDALGIEPGAVIADFGSGSGAYVLAIAQKLNGSGHVYAVDVQRDLLRRIKTEAHRRGLQTVGVIWGDLEAPGGSKLADRLLDLVLVSNLLFQVEHKVNLLLEAARVLKEDGRLVVIDWSDSFGGLGPRPRDVVTKERAIALAGETGFSLSGEFEAGAHHYGLIFAKNNSVV